MKQKFFTIIIALFFAFFSLCSVAQIQSFRGKVDNGYNFWLYTPPGAKSDEIGKPLILFLHGSSLCGTDMNKVRRYGTLDAVEKGLSIDAYIVAPQNPGGAWKPERLKNILDWVQANYKTDIYRVYVVGMSLGGYGTMDFAGTFPERVASAVALCGGSTLKNFEKLGKVPLWIIHGTADRAVSVKESRRVADAMKANGWATMLRYEEMQGASHGALARVFYLRELYDWLFSYNSEELEPNFDTRQIAITQATLKDAYRSIDRNAPKIAVYDQTAPTSTSSAASSIASSATANNSITASATATTSTTEGSTTEGSATANPTTNHTNRSTSPNSGSTLGEVKVHIIKRGDTLGAIARRYGRSVSELCKSNNLTPTTTLHIGQKILL